MRWSCVCLVLPVLLISCATASDSSLDSVIGRHIAARGGVPAIEAVQSMRVDLTVEEPKFKVDIRYVADRRGRARVDVVHDGKRVFSEGVDERGGWAAGEDGVVKEIAVAGTAALERGRLFNLYGLHEYGGLGHRLVLEGPETIDGRVYDVIRVELADGFRTWRLIGRANGRMEIQRDFRALHPDMDPTEIWIESRYSDFRAIDGVLFPFASRQTARDSGEWLQTTQVRTIELNPSLSDTELRRPS